MIIPFVKYQGTGNDFVIIDNRDGIFGDTDVARLCHRRFGIGADGLMLLESAEGYDFRMVYFNSDGKLSSMCGNGGRCIAHFAHSLGLGNGDWLNFIAVDGSHKAKVNGKHVELEMISVSEWQNRTEDTYILNTGSPHYIRFITESPEQFDLLNFARSVRYGEEFNAQGINVNAVKVEAPGVLSMRTYERGVEDETYSCGTGVTAAALSYCLKAGGNQEITVNTPGGSLSVRFRKDENGFSDVWLCGPAENVFTGEIA